MKFTIPLSWNRQNLTHSSLVGLSLLINWTSPFPILGLSYVIFGSPEQGSRRAIVVPSALALALVLASTNGKVLR